MAAVRAQRGADVRVAVLHRRPRRDPATIATASELRSANSLTQTTQWSTLTAGTPLGGLSTGRPGYEGALLINSLSFAFSAITAGAPRRPTVPGDEAHTTERAAGFH